MAKGSEAINAFVEEKHALSRLKVRIQYLGKFEGKLKRQVCTEKDVVSKQILCIGVAVDTDS